MCVLRHFSRFRIFATLWTTTRQAPLSVGFSTQEWVAMPSLMSPALAGGFFTTGKTWEAQGKGAY